MYSLDTDADYLAKQVIVDRQVWTSLNLLKVSSRLGFNPGVVKVFSFTSFSPSINPSCTAIPFMQPPALVLTLCWPWPSPGPWWCQHSMPICCREQWIICHHISTTWCVYMDSAQPSWACTINWPWGSRQPELLRSIGAYAITIYMTKTHS